MKEIIYEAIFNIWCDSGDKPGERTEISCAIEAISNLFKAGWKEKLFIETEVMKAVCASEKVAFIDGVRMGAGFASGRLFYEDLPEIER